MSEVPQVELKPLLLLLYTHPWGLKMLDRLRPFGSPLHDLIVEIGEVSILAPAFGAVHHPAGIGGFTELLDPSTDARKLALTVRGVPAPVLLASMAPVPTAQIQVALDRLPRIPGRHRAVVLALHIDAAPRFAFAFAAADQVAVLWDQADLPGESLEAVGRILLREEILSPGVWQGFHLYIDPQRDAPEIRARRDAMESVFSDFGALVVRHAPAGSP